MLLDCFSPLALEEFRRVLKPGGHFFYVVPGGDHLWELKQVLYEMCIRDRSYHTSQDPASSPCLFSAFSI